ncbi:MAG: hypothetical protein WB509_27100 [Acetobacteraceae bacterium]|jgi:Tfp pilus assembly protein PilW
MISLLIAVLAVGVIIRVFLDSWPPSKTQQPQDQLDEERAQMMAVIAQSFF